MFCSSCITYSQTSTDFRMFTSNYENLLGAEVRLPNDLKYKSLYIDANRTRYYNGKKRGTKNSFDADYSNLKDVTFEIKDYFEVENKIGDMVFGILTFLELFNASTGSIFIEVNSKSYKEQLVLLTELELPPLNEIYCQNFFQTFDKFERIKRIYTSFDDYIYFTKRIDKDDNELLLINFDISGSTPNFLKKGVKIIFDDGEMLDYPQEKIDVSVSKKDYRDYDVKAVFLMDNELIKKVKTNLITDVWLYVYDVSPPKFYAQEIQAKFNCLIENTYLLKE